MLTLLLLPRLSESLHGFPTCCFLEMLKYSQSSMEQPGLALPPGLDGSSQSCLGKRGASLWYSVPPSPCPQLTHCLHLEAAAASSPAGKQLPPHRAHRKHRGIYRALRASCTNSGKNLHSVKNNLLHPELHWELVPRDMFPALSWAHRSWKEVVGPSPPYRWDVEPFQDYF